MSLVGSHLLEEQQRVSFNRGIGPEYRVRQAHDGVEVAFLDQVLFEPGLDTLTEQGAVVSGPPRPCSPGFQLAG